MSRRKIPAPDSPDLPDPGEDAEGRDGIRVTINDIARLARVSKKTVSRVINESPLVREETRHRVKEIIQKYGYAPDPQARALAFRRSFLIGLIYDNPSPQYVVNVQRGLLDALEDTSFQLVLRPCDRSDPEVLNKVKNFVVQQRPFGVVLTPSISEDEDVVGMLRELDCAYVRVASVDIDTPHRLVRTHDAHGGLEAARHIASLGHHRIAHIHGPANFRSAHERMAGFKAGLAEFGLALDPALTLEGAYTFDSGVRCAQQLFGRPNRPTAVFLGNDEMALGVYHVAQQMGLSIPHDVSIVGYDDTPMAARIWPPLTTVRMPIREMGKAAATVLLAGFKGETLSSAVTFEPEIVVRQSTAPCKSQPGQG